MEFATVLLACILEADNCVLPSVKHALDIGGPNEALTQFVRERAMRPGSRTDALEILYEFPGDNAKTLTCIASLLPNANINQKLWLSSIASKLTPTKESAELQRRLICDNDHLLLRQAAASYLSKMGEAGNYSVTQMLIDDDPAFRRIGCSVAKRTGKNSREVIVMLCMIAIFDEEEISRVAIDALRASFRDNRRWPVLKR